MPRILASAFLNEYKDGGRYHTFLEYVKQDPELQFEIRVKNEVMIYFEKCKLLTIQHRQMQNDNIIMLDNKYIRNRRDNLKLNTLLNTPENLTDESRIKGYFEEAKMLVKNYKKHDEFLVQQKFKMMHDSFDDDYIAIDMEWAPELHDVPMEERPTDKTRIDLVLISNKVNEAGYNDVYLAELKYGLSSADGDSGMEEHLRKSKDIIRRIVLCQKLMIDVSSLMRQKKALGLFSGQPVKYNIPQRPKMMFILAYRNESEKQNFLNRVEALSDGRDEIAVEYLHIDEEYERSYQVSRFRSMSFSDNDSAFKSVCRLHQAWFREKILNLKMGRNPRTHQAVGESEEEFENRRKTYTDITHLTDEDAMRLMNFVPAFHDDIYIALRKRFGVAPTSHDLMNDMLRSECIPWNFFVPMMQDKDAAVKVLKEITNRGDITRIVDFRIEFNPKTLEDNTAFDAYFRYETEKGEAGIIGIETKYTEEGYKVHPKEKKFIHDGKSPYCQTMQRSGCFKSDDATVFDCPELIQIWRNHLLAISMNIKGAAKYYDSVTIYPSGNTHFYTDDRVAGALGMYEKQLTEKGKRTFHHVTFDDFVQILRTTYKEKRFEEWLDYIQERYISLQKGCDSTVKRPNYNVNKCSAEIKRDLNVPKPVIARHNVERCCSKADYSLLQEGRREWVLNLVGFRLNDMISSSEAKAGFTTDAPKASQEVSDEAKYYSSASFIKAYDMERHSTHDKKNAAYWNFCREVKTEDVIYLAKGAELYAFGIVKGNKVETRVTNRLHAWKVEWHLFPEIISINPHIATPFFVNLSNPANRKNRDLLRNAIFKE